jgi:hypothetical protein
MRYALLASLIAASWSFSAAAAPGDQPRREEPGDLVVTGSRDRERQVEEFVGALTRTPVFGQISRFAEPVCPAAIGLSANQNRDVADRIRSVAEAAGIEVGRAGCTPNVFVVVAQDRDKLISEIRRNWIDPRGDRVPVPSRNGPAIALHLEGQLDGDGIPVGVKEDNGDGRSGYYIAEGTGASSRIRPVTRPHFLRAALVMEPDVLAGLTTMQLADYAAMRLLAKTDPTRLENSAAPTILNVLDAPMGSEVPISLTQWDLGFLTALYASGDRRYASQQRREMRQVLSRELDRPR